MFVYASYLSSRCISGTLLGFDADLGYLDIIDSARIARVWFDAVPGPVTVAHVKYASIRAYVKCFIEKTQIHINSILKQTTDKINLSDDSTTDTEKAAPVKKLRPPKKPLAVPNPPKKTEKEVKPPLPSSVKQTSPSRHLPPSRIARRHNRAEKHLASSQATIKSTTSKSPTVLKGFVRAVNSNDPTNTSSGSESRASLVSLRSYWDNIERRGSPSGKTSSELYVDRRISEIVADVQHLKNLAAKLEPPPSPAVNQASVKAVAKDTFVAELRKRRSGPGLADYTTIANRYENMELSGFHAEFKHTSPLDVVIDFGLYIDVNHSRTKAEKFVSSFRYTKATVNSAAVLTRIRSEFRKAVK